MSATATDKLWLRWPGHSSTPSLGRPPEPALATSRYIIMKRKDTRLVAHELVPRSWSSKKERITGH